MTEYITLIEAAELLDITYQQAHERVVTRAIDGELVKGIYQIDRDSVTTEARLPWQAREREIRRVGENMPQNVRIIEIDGIEYVTLGDAAKLLDLSRQRIYQRVGLGTLRAVSYTRPPHPRLGKPRPQLVIALRDLG